MPGGNDILPLVQVRCRGCRCEARTLPGDNWPNSFVGIIGSRSLQQVLTLWGGNTFQA
jgi:hypothetical protein